MAATIRGFIKDNFAEKNLIVASNREPYIHKKSGLSIKVEKPAGGVVSALDDILKVTGGTWVAWGSGAADFDVTGEDDALRVPPESPAYRLRRLRLTAEEVLGYYIETANRAHWPLCHGQLAHFVYDAACWGTYQSVNQRFAAATLAESLGRPAICWIQDYHFGLLPALLRRTRRLFIHQFWHIPWPAPDLFRLLPSGRALLTGLLGNHLLGFQTKGDARNFLGSVQRFVKGAVVEPRKGLVSYKGRRTVVRDFPISIELDTFRRLATTPAAEAIAGELRQRHLPNGGQLLLGVDRADYTKGLPRRFRAFARMLEEHPELRGQVTLLQIAVPTRSDLPEYVAFERSVLDIATEINATLGQGDWQPIRLVQGSLDQATLAAHYRAADVCIVTPLLDGMNLVAKEYVACQPRPQGVLVLSRFAGAARELREALIVNPYDLGAVAATLHAALTLAPEERERRMRALIRRLEGNTVQDWMDDIFAEVRRLRRDDE